MFVCPDCALTGDAAGACPHDGVERLDCAADPLLGSVVAGHRICAIIGAGGMGRVYRGRHMDIGSQVAIKVLLRHPAERPDLLARFFAEARAVNHIQQPNIIKVFDFGTLPDGRAFILMELLEGESLRARVARGPLPFAEVVRMGCEVLAALAAAHAAGIIHRDIKPDNVFLCARGRVKVLDFGLAKLDPEVAGGVLHTKTGMVVGTPAYMAPEQVLGNPVDARTDLYAVGIVLFEACTGKPPFVAKKIPALWRMHLYSPAPPVSSWRVDTPPALAAHIARALEKDPNARHASATAMAQLLAKSLTDPAPPPVHRPTPPAPSAALPPPQHHVQPAPAPPRRRALAIVAAIAIVIGFAAAAGIAWWRIAESAAPSPSARAKKKPPDDEPERDEPSAKTATPPATPSSLVRTPGWPPYNPRHLDLDRFIRELETSQVVIDALGSGAELMALTIDGAAADGTIDLSGPFRVVMVTLRATQPGRCIEVQLAGELATAAPAPTGACNRPVIAAPRCTVRGAIARARRELGDGSGTWRLDLNSSVQQWAVGPSLGQTTNVKEADCSD